MSKNMHFFNKKIISLALFSGIFSPISAHIHRIEHWSNGAQSLYLVHDYHVSSNPQNKVCDQQQLELIDMAKQHNAFVVTEDMSVYNNKAFFNDPLNYDPNVPAVHKHRKKHPCTRPPIVGLTVRCQDQKIPVHNVEFRQASVASRHGEERIPAHLTLAISDKVRDEVKNYNDGPILNNYYQEEVSLYDRNISKAHPIFEPIKKATKPLKEVTSLLRWCIGADEIVKAGTHFDDSSVTIWGKAARLDLATDLYDMRLLDARIMHTIYQNKSKPCIFICVGSEHLRHIKPVLQNLEYEPLGTVGQSYIQQDGTATEPDAISVTQAFETLPQPITPINQPEDANNNIKIWIVIALAMCILLIIFGRKTRRRSIKNTAGMLLFFASILTQSSLYGYIYCVDILESQKYNTKIVLLSDRHELGSADDIRQRKELSAWIKEAKVQTAIEDGGSYAFTKLGIDRTGKLTKSIMHKSCMIDLDKEVGSNLVTNIDQRIPAVPRFDEHIFWGTDSIKNCKEVIAKLRKEKYVGSLNRYKNDILSQLKNHILPECEKLFAAVAEKDGTINDRIKAIKYKDAWDHIIQSYIARANNTKIESKRFKGITPATKIKNIMTIYGASLLDAAACNFINKALQAHTPIICIALGGSHIEALIHPLTDEKMGFTRKTIAGKALATFKEKEGEFEPIKENLFEPIKENLYDLLKNKYWPSFFVQHENTIVVASSALIGLCVGSRYGLNQSVSLQLGLTTGMFFGSITGYNLIKLGWNYLTRLYNQQ